MIFSGPMVRALLNRSKRETRRAVTRRRSVDGYTGKMPCQGLWGSLDWATAEDMIDFEDVPYLSIYDAKCGTLSRFECRVQKGDRIWVKETWHSEPRQSDCPDLAYRADEPGECPPWTWSSPMLMPRRACRLVLDVTEQPYPQRLSDITDEQAVAEGVQFVDREPPFACWRGHEGLPFEPTARAAYFSLFGSINGEVDKSQWCWVYPGLRPVGA